MSRNGQSISFTVTVTDEQIRNFTEIFSGFISNFLWKVKTDPDLIHERLEDDRERQEILSAEYQAFCIDTFNCYLAAGETARTALSLTVSTVFDRFPLSSFDQVKKILTKAKLLKNTGYYKKR
jgi:hypothetical protein